MRSALVLIDVQKDFFARPGLSPNPSGLIPRMQKLLDDCRALALPVIHVRTAVSADGLNRMPHWQKQDYWACVEGNEGILAPQGLQEQEGEIVIHKQFFSAFGCPELLPLLQKRQISRLIVAGLYLHGCIRSSVLDAYERGFVVWVADDALGSTEPHHAEITRDYLNGRAASFISSEILVARLRNQLPNNAPCPDKAIPAACIAGNWLKSDSDDFYIHYNPVNDREILAQVPFCTDSLTVQACDTAHSVFADWSRTSALERSKIMGQWAEQLERRQDELMELLVREVGKPVCDARDEFQRTLEHIRIAARLGKDNKRIISSDRVMVRFRPRGVVALITPWNNPLAIPAGKLAAALCWGNTVVWKPSPKASCSAMMLLETLTEAGIPAGVVNLIQGDAEVARKLVLDSRVAAVSITAASATGHAIEALCSSRSKPLQAELGGNNAAIILADWPLHPENLISLTDAMFGFAGQRCTAIRRLIVERSCQDAFKKALIASVGELTVGLPEQETTRIGPLISSAHRARVQSIIVAAVRDGARILAEAKVIPKQAGQCWMAPVVLTDVNPNSELVREETFGPVAVVQFADDLSHAIQLANSVPQGLVAGLYSTTAEAREQFEQQIAAGMIKLTPGALRIHPEAPFCGWKDSAIGPPEHGIWDRDFYAQAQTIYSDIS